MPVELLPWQRDYLRRRTDRNIHEKSRDIRSSTLFVHDRVTDSIWNGGDILIAGNKEDTSVNLVNIGRQFLLGLPEPPRLSMDNVTELRVHDYDFSIKALTRPTSARMTATGRSERCKHLIVTEYAFCEWPEDFLAALLGAVVAGGTADIESTHNGVGSHFNRMVAGAKNGLNGFTHFGHDFRVNPEHDAAWEAQKRRELSPRKFAEEYECEPSASGRCFFEASSLVLRSRQRDWSCGKAIPACLGAVRDLCRESELEIYQLPQEGHTYTAGCDCATGTGADFDDITLLDNETLEEVAHLHDQSKCDVFGQKIDALARVYGGRYAIERPGPGEAVIQECRRLGTPGLWRSPHDGKFGWPTSGTGPHARRPMLDMFERDLRLGELGIGSQRTLDECRVFQFGNDDEPRAAAGYNDDCVMSAAIANKVRKAARPGAA
jgi:hypothetical protein